MNPEELLPRIARIDERTKLILQRLDKINGKIEVEDISIRIKYIYWVKLRENIFGSCLMRRIK